MCGRYGRRGHKQKVAEAFQVRTSLEDVDFEETFDAAPGSVQPVVMMNEEGERNLSLMKWGSKFPDGKLRFNVRSEGVATANFWKDKFKTHRCIIPASSYFEWQGEKAPKSKYEIEVPGQEYFGIAAVWSAWEDPKTNTWMNTFSTFTSEPNALIEKIHIRQPVIIQPRDFVEWLAPSERPPVHLLRVMPEEGMRMVVDLWSSRDL